MAKEVFMPKLSSTMETGTLLQWFKQEGEPVEVGEPLLEVMTDKINIEVEAYEEGILLKRYYDEDEEVPVNGIVGYIGEEGEQVPEEKPGAGNEPPAPESTPKAPVPEPAGQEIEAEKAGGVRATPAARKLSREHSVNLSLIQGSGAKGRIHAADVHAAVDGQQVRSTPLAKKEAEANNVDLSAVKGSGSYGKITRSDVAAPRAVEELQSEPLQGVRKVVAERMQKSANEVPHVTLHTEVDMEAAMELRTQLLPVIEKQTGQRLSVTELLMFVGSRALRKHPDVHASMTDGRITKQEAVHMGLAVATDRGLLVPVIRHTEAKGLAELAAETKQTAAAARNGTLPGKELSGSTFTISNLGMYAVDHFTPIINQPEAAILGVGRIQEKPVVKNGEITVGRMMAISLSFDHRIIDGAPAAAFLTDFKQMLEQPYQLFV
ncbi:dihydrolipoamide acetyltransferase family protein [Marinococcus halophilus]|uniref:dihydrolipoamide acetyltransferase family protein n=1 Tax=Marinococcus halophilus TaxID=1371 RepID=UPI0009A5BF8B|nr:dihydrolipoamide acetyltransferase family protein [Marinococcus halophilus]